MADTSAEMEDSHTGESTRGGGKGGKKRPDEDYPPNSRLFIICNKSNTETELKEAFSRFGDLEFVRILCDRRSGDSKGIAYVKFAKTSQAANAMESLNGKCLENNDRPLKVMVATDRAKGSVREPNEEERLFRLFVIVSKDTKEVTLREHFEQFGNVCDVRILKDRDSGESKGVAYIRFNRASHAAVAFENCDKSYKAKFAEPRPPNNRNVIPEPPPMGHGFRSHSHHYGGHRMEDDYCVGRPSRDSFDDYRNNVPSSDRLQIVASAGVTQQQLWKLFDLIPGLEYCDVHMRNYESDGDPVFATVKYRSCQSTSMALMKLNNFEYPPGKPLVVRELPVDTNTMGRNSMDFSDPNVSSDIAKLADALAQAHSIMKAAGINVPSGTGSGGGGLQTSSPKPMDLSEPGYEQRLFIVCYPTVLSYNDLYDIFGRFNGLVNVRMLNGKKCGFVTYSTEESARRAMDVLHGQSFRGVQLTVKLAEPLDMDKPSGNGTKRQKVN